MKITIEFIIFVGLLIFLMYILSPLMTPKPALFEKFEDNSPKKIENELEKYIPIYEKLMNLNANDTMDIGNLKIPMPNFDAPKEKFENQTQKIVEKQKRVTGSAKPAVKPAAKPKGNVAVISKKDITNQDLCRFHPTGNMADKCPDAYPVFTGASFSAPGYSLCGEGVTYKPADAVGFLRDGKLISIKVLDGGDNYEKAPAVAVVGDSRLPAKAEAVVKDGKIIDIKVTDQGKGYASTPNIVIAKSDKPINCKLCCKREL